MKGHDNSSFAKNSDSVHPSWLSTMAQWSTSAMQGGLTVCPPFHMSLPNTFPFTRTVSICQRGLPHGVNPVTGTENSERALFHSWSQL